MFGRGFIFFLLVVCVSTGLCQQRLILEVDASYTTILNAAKNEPEAYPFVLNNEATNPIFFPSDVQQQFGQGIYYLHFSRLNEKIIAIPDGTGRVYDFSAENRKVKVERLDNTTYVGYNFSTLVFTCNDTLYSLGGYGFWKYNGTLRYFDKNTRGWELAPTNIEVPVSGDPNYSGVWLSKKENSLYYVARNLRQDGIKSYVPAASPFQDSSVVYRLDLNKKDWIKLGQLSKESVPYINTSKKIVELPFGELAISGGIRDKKIILINYHQNRIELLKDSLTLQLYNRIYTGFTSKFTWYGQGYLNIGPSFPDTLFRLAITKNSFTPLPVKLYISDYYKIPNKTSGWFNTLLLVSGGLLFGLVIGRVISRRTEQMPNQKPNQPVPLKNLFNQYEVNILKGFVNHNFSMLPEEVNIVLETDRKSVEVQKKYRSEAIRGINIKCNKLLHTDQRLILQERLSDDRRQFIYRLNGDLFQALKKATEGL